MSKALYNYCITSHTDMFDAFVENVRYWCTYCYCAQEWGTEKGKEHVQAFVQSHLSMKKIGKAYGYHVELARGTKDQNIAYCSKDNGKKFEFGVFSLAGQGKRNDLVEIQHMIKDGKSLVEIEEKFPSHYLRLSRYIEDSYYRRLRVAVPYSRAQRRNVHLITGPSGSGKTKLAHMLLKDKTHYRLSNQDNTMWWRGYTGECVVLIDDYKGGMKLATLLGIIDPWYNSDVSVAPSQLIRMASDVIITSSIPMEDWYPGMDVEELRRRVNVTTYMFSCE